VICAFSKNQILTGFKMADHDVNENVSKLVKFLSGKNAHELQAIIADADRQNSLEAEQISQRRISLDEYKALLADKLKVDNLRWFLEITRCKHLYLLLYPDAKLTMAPENIKWLEVPEYDDELSGSDGTTSDGDSNIGYYLEDLLRILNHINRSNRNYSRLKFFNFLDLCWEAVGYDLWGLGTFDKVFDIKENKELKPWTVRAHFLVYIKNYLIKQTTEIGEEIGTNLGDAFKGTIILFFGILKRSIDNLILYSCSYLQRLSSPSNKDQGSDG
jgi:hypothetical protein